MCFDEIEDSEGRAGERLRSSAVGAAPRSGEGCERRSAKGITDDPITSKAE